MINDLIDALDDYIAWRCKYAKEASQKRFDLVWHTDMANKKTRLMENLQRAIDSTSDKTLIQKAMREVIQDV